MSKNNLKLAIILHLSLSILIILLLIDFVDTYGWGLWQIILVMFATKDVVKTIQLIDLYWQNRQKN